MFEDSDIEAVYDSEVGRGGDRPFWSGVFNRKSFRVFNPDAKPVHTGTRRKRSVVRSQAQIELSKFLLSQRDQKSKATRAAWVRDGLCVDCGKPRAPHSKARCIDCLNGNRDKARNKYVPKTGKRLGARERRAIAATGAGCEASGDALRERVAK